MSDNLPPGYENPVYHNGTSENISRPNYMWTGIFILLGILLFLIFVKSCKGPK